MFVNSSYVVITLQFEIISSTTQYPPIGFDA